MTPRTFNNGYRGNNGNIYNMIFLSLIIHLIVITVILISVPTTSRRLTFGMAYSVQLVGPEVILPAKDSSVLKDILQSNEATSSIIIKREIIGLASTPAKKEETAKLNIEKAVGALRQKESSTPQASPAAKPSAAASTPARGNVPQAQVSSRLNEYNAFIQSRIHGNWTLPPALWPKDNVETIIEVRILRNGAVERLNFEKRSGNRYVDDSAMKAVQKSMPFPPFPDGMMDNYIERSIRFHSSELR
ncbi:TonB C-terminal domain-containing protein [Candidatus Bathyarchaeota archaeon]|nr:TonB C-terminal domain-containing protein [Candidatus Bathyarchaeota archaeon]